MTKRWTVALSLAALQAFAAVAAACPMCKDTVTDDAGIGGATTGLPNGFKVSIYLMLGGVFCVMGLVGGIIVKGVRGGNKPLPPPNKPPGFPLD